MAGDGKPPEAPRAQSDHAVILESGLAASTGISGEALRKAEQYIEAEEGATNRLVGLSAAAVTAVAVAMSLFHLYTAIAGVPPLFSEFPIVATQPLRYTHVAFVLVLCFLLFPLARRFRNRIQWFDVIVAAVAVAILIYAIAGGEDFTDRATIPTQTDVILGIVFIDPWKRRAAPSAGSFRWSRSCSWLTRWRGLICRRPGTIVLWRRSMVGHLFITLKAFSAFRSMCRRR
jgi:hypothetical protein